MGKRVQEQAVSPSFVAKAGVRAASVEARDILRSAWQIHPLFSVVKRWSAAFSVRRAVIAFFALFVFSILIAFFSAVMSDRSKIRRELATNSRDLAMTIERGIARKIDYSDFVLLRIAAVTRTVDWHNPAALAKLKSEIAAFRSPDSDIASICLFDVSGKNLLSIDGTTQDLTLGQLGLPFLPLDPRLPPNVRNIQVGQRLGADGRTRLILARQIDDPSGRPLGTAALSIDPGYLTRIFAALDISPAYMIEIFRTDGQLLTRNAGSPEKYLPLVPELAAAGEFDELAMRLVNDGDQAYFVAGRRIGPLPLLIQLAAPRSIVVALWRQHVVRYAEFFALAPFLAITLMLFALRQIASEEAARAALQSARNELMSANEGLEARVAERTIELADLNTMLIARAEERDLLFDELNHRVKNNLQLIIGLFSLQFGKIENVEARQALEQGLRRIQAIGLVHELLNNAATIDELDFDIYLHLLCERLAAAFSDQIVVQCQVTPEHCKLPLDLSIRLALIVNELLTNALKHAFPDVVAGGIIAVTFARREEICHLIIDDNGIGIAAAPKAGGSAMGLQLIELLSRFIGGSATHEPRYPGTHFELSFAIPQSRPSRPDSARGSAIPS